MWSVPLVSVGKLRRAVINAGTGEPVVQQQMSTSFDGLGATRPPPITNISPLKVKSRVSPVALGMAGMLPVVLVTGSKLNELVVSSTRPPWQSDAPATSMMPSPIHAGAYITPSGVFTLCSHLEP